MSLLLLTQSKNLYDGILGIPWIKLHRHPIDLVNHVLEELSLETAEVVFPCPKTPSGSPVLESKRQVRKIHSQEACLGCWTARWTTTIISLDAWIWGDTGWQLRRNQTPIHSFDGTIRAKIWLWLIPLIFHPTSSQISASAEIKLAVETLDGNSKATDPGGINQGKKVAHMDPLGCSCLGYNIQFNLAFEPLVKIWQCWTRGCVFSLL